MLYGSGVASVKSDDSDSIFPGIVTLLMLAAAVAFGSRVYWLVFNFASKGPPTTSGWFATYRSDVHQWNPDIIAGPFENRDACYHDDAVIGSDDAICVYLHDVPLAIIPQSDESQ
jgi:hypothetical protein